MHACMYVLYTSYIYHVYKVYTWHWFDHFANLLKKLHRKYSMNFKKTFKTVVLLGTCDKLLLKNDFTLKLVLKIQQSSPSHIWHQITRSGNFMSLSDSFIHHKSLNISYKNTWHTMWHTMQSKSVDWFLYDNGLRHERVKILYEAWENPNTQQNK